MNNLDAVVSTERIMSASPSRVFAAFERPDQLARWWGPKGFTSTFEQFEFKPGGRWVYAMHAPNGASYANEGVFRELQPDAWLVIEHVVAPRFTLTVTLTASGHQTHVAWVQEFESAELAAKMRPISTGANEENLDRLQALVEADQSPGGGSR